MVYAVKHNISLMVRSPRNLMHFHTSMIFISHFSLSHHCCNHHCLPERPVQRKSVCLSSLQTWAFQALWKSPLPLLPHSISLPCTEQHPLSENEEQMLESCLQEAGERHFSLLLSQGVSLLSVRVCVKRWTSVDAQGNVKVGPQQTS